MTLPDGWILRVSRSKGKVFYLNTHTQQTQWTRPTQAATAPLATTAEADEDAQRCTKKRKRETNNDDDPVATNAKPKTAAPQKIAERTAVINDRRAAIARCMRAGASVGGKAFAPWAHQVDAVEKLLEALVQPLQQSDGSRANRFLLQHSTGSGKTVTIAALTHQLLYARDANKRRFHTVVLLIDRIKLDEQVGDSVERFLRRNGIDAIHRATSINHLAGLLAPPSQGEADPPQQRVIVSTIQKIGLLAKNKVLLTRLLHGHVVASSDGDGDVFSRIAIITDEAHRSHTAATRHTIEAVMNASDESDESPVTFVGFTATPNVEALRLFGSSGDDECLRPFHCYTMARAVADARIVDVLQHYACVRCELELSIPPDVQQQLVETKAMRFVMDAASDSVDVLKAKSAYMMEDFERARAVWSRAKCMIVTRSRRDVVRYYELITTFVENKRSSWRVFAVFSGTITTEGSGLSRSVTEQSLNPKHLSLASSDIVIVCDKLDTGYSDPLLTCMYIDRYLRSSVQTVQLLSRLNRVHPDKRSVRIVDFANHAAQIRRHFATFWHQAATRCDGDGDDELMPVADWRTALAVAGSSAETNGADLDNRKALRERVETLIRTLDRDAFQQLLDAVRLGVSARAKMDDEDPVEAKSPLSHDHFKSLKTALESAIASSDSAELSTDDVVRKMKTRVKRYEIVFTGHVNPEELSFTSNTDRVTSES